MVTLTHCRLLQAASALPPPWSKAERETPCPQSSHFWPPPWTPSTWKPWSLEGWTGEGSSSASWAAPSHPPPLHSSPPTSPGSSKIDIHPFLKLSRSGYWEMRKQMSQAQWRIQWGWGGGGAVPLGLESCKTKGLRSQERGLRAQVTPQIEADSPATNAVLAPFHNIQ